MDEIQDLTAHTLNAIEGIGDVTGEITQKYSYQFMTNCMGFVSLTILLWDHIATFGDEVDYVWNGTNGPFKYLFLLNRYLIPLGFSLNIFAYLSPTLSNAVQGSVSAKRYTLLAFNYDMAVLNFLMKMHKFHTLRRCHDGYRYKYPIMMFYRVYVLYWGPWSASGRRYVCILAVILLVEFAVNAWLLTKGGPVPDSLGCEMIFLDVSPALASSSAWLPLLFDTLAFLLIFRVSYKNALPENTIIQSGFNLNRRILEDGLLYYCPILVVTLTLSLMISLSKPGSQNLMAQLELIITVTMMSRITINLKKSYHKKKDIDTQLASMPSPVYAIAGHARAQISTVLDITRSRVQNNPDIDVEMVTRNRDSDSSSDSDIECGPGGTKNCVV